jgi:hypothetical protein
VSEHQSVECDPRWGAASASADLVDLGAAEGGGIVGALTGPSLVAANGACAYDEYQDHGATEEFWELGAETGIQSVQTTQSAVDLFSMYADAGEAAVKVPGLGEVALATEYMGGVSGQMFGEQAEFSLGSQVGGWLDRSIGERSLAGWAGQAAEDAVDGYAGDGSTAGAMLGNEVTGLLAPVSAIAGVGLQLGHDVVTADQAVGDSMANGTGWFGGAAAADRRYATTPEIESSYQRDLAILQALEGGR